MTAQAPSYIETLAILYGIRLNAIAARLSCETEFQKKIQKNLIPVLDYAISKVREILREERTQSEDSDPFDLYMAEKTFAEFEYELGEYLEIDSETREYKNEFGGRWILVSSKEDLPYKVDVTEDFGPMAKILSDLNEFITVTVSEIVYP